MPVEVTDLFLPPSQLLPLISNESIQHHQHQSRSRSQSCQEVQHHRHLHLHHVPNPWTDLHCPEVTAAVADTHQNTFTNFLLNLLRHHQLDLLRNHKVLP